MEAVQKENNKRDTRKKKNEGETGGKRLLDEIKGEGRRGRRRRVHKIEGYVQVRENRGRITREMDGRRNVGGNTNRGNIATKEEKEKLN